MKSLLFSKMSSCWLNVVNAVDDLADKARIKKKIRQLNISKNHY